MQSFRIPPSSLHVKVWPASNAPAPTVLFVHGWNSSTLSASNYVDYLNQAGYTVVAADVRGHGQSKGDSYTLTNADWFKDVLQIYDWTTEHPSVDPERMCVVGSSWGGYLTACLLAEKTPKAAVLRVPAGYSDREWSGQRNSTVVTQKEIDDSKACKAFAKFQGSALIVESGDDDVIPHWMVMSYRKANPQAKYALMENAPHGLGQSPLLHKQYMNILLPWLKQTL